MSSMDGPDGWIGRVGGLPDPEVDRRFYEGVPARRLFAFVIDVIVVWGVAIGLAFATLGIGFLFLGFLVAVADFFYRVLTISGRSATLGMRAMEIELRDGSGARFGFGTALFHTLLFYLSFTFFVLHLVSIVMMAGSAMGRALHDLPFGSTMIKSPD
ncbi:MAG: RDD family protein [Pseudomonadota bacterium]